MNPQDQNQPIEVNNPLSSMQAGEQNIFEIKRHPIGLIIMLVSSAFALLLVAVLIFGVGPYLFPDARNEVNRFGSLIFAVLLILTLAFVLISNIIYWGNRWILTSDSLTQILQRELFDKQSSQLSLANLEDVTAQTNGILAKIFNFGTLKAETAGERSKFVFIYCPDPNKYAQAILMARERFEQGRSAEDRPQQGPEQTT